MSRNTAAWIAFAVLSALTLVTWQLGETGASAWLLAGVAWVKVLVIGAVFLELTRSRPVFGLLFGSGVLVVLVASAGLVIGS